MKILVCVKQVPESDVPFHINETAEWIDFETSPEYRMNRLDEFAVEEAVLLKERFGRVLIDVLSVGPERCADVIKRAIGMGADSGIHLQTEDCRYVSSAAVASMIAEQAKNRHYDLILTGAMSEDNMQGQVGPMIAARLSLACACGVIHAQVLSGQNRIYVEREIEGGNRETLQLCLPAVLTIQSGINKPRYPSLSNLLRANKQKLETMSIQEKLSNLPQEMTLHLAYPQKNRAGITLRGSTAEKAERLLQICRDKAFIY